MTLNVGSWFGHYTITVKHGNGIMGRVCRDIELKLGRLLKRQVAYACVLVGLAIGGLLCSSDVFAQTLEGHVYVSVLDGDGVPVQGLAERDFIVQEDGVGQDVLRVSPATDPLQVDILVDSSAGARLLIGDFREALHGFVEGLPANNQIALVTFGGIRTVIVEPTDDVERMAAGIDKLYARPDSAAYLVDALHTTAEDLERREAPRPVVVVVATTGLDLSGRHPREFVNRLRRLGASMYAVVVPGLFRRGFPVAGEDRTAEAFRAFALDQGPRQTGGRRIDLAMVNGLDGALSRIALELSNQYLVSYTSPDVPVSTRTVQVGVSRGERVTVRTVSMLPGSLPR